jgi:hypothetical protein
MPSSLAAWQDGLGNGKEAGLQDLPRVVAQWVSPGPAWHPVEPSMERTSSPARRMKPPRIEQEEERDLW